MRKRMSMRFGSTSTARLERPAKVAASGCAPPIPPRPPVSSHLPGTLPVVVLAHRLGEGLVGSLHDALRADVDPRARRHLAEHHQALAIELEEMLPVGPVSDEIGIGEQHTRCGLVGLEHADRLAGLDQQGLVVLEAAQRAHDGIEAFPVARGPPDAAVDDQLAAGSPRHRGRGCCAACAAPLPAANPCRSARCHAARAGSRPGIVVIIVAPRLSRPAAATSAHPRARVAKQAASSRCPRPSPRGATSSARCETRAPDAAW